MRQLVQHQRARLASRGGGEPRRPAREERRVLHRFRAGAGGRVDDRETWVRVGRQPRPVEGEPLACGAKVALPRAAVVGLEEEEDVDLREPLRGDGLLPHLEAGGEGEGEVVNVLGPGVDADAPGRLVRLLDDAPGDRDLPLHLVGEQERDVVVAEVGEELGGRVERSASPTRFGRLGELRVPLPREDEVVLPAGAEGAAREARLEIDLEDERFAGPDRPRERDAGERPVVGIAAGGGRERDPARQVGSVGEGDPLQLAEAEVGRARRRGEVPARAWSACCESRSGRGGGGRRGAPGRSC